MNFLIKVGKSGYLGKIQIGTDQKNVSGLGMKALLWASI